MRSNAEILARIEARKNADLLGIEVGDLVACLPYEAAKPFLQSSVTSEMWVPVKRDRDSLLANMLDYMPFAWQKANDGRGLSALRSMAHYSAWTWLAGDDFGELTEYEFYGKPHLIRICEQYGWEYRQWDDGVRVNVV